MNGLTLLGYTEERDLKICPQVVKFQLPLPALSLERGDLPKMDSGQVLDLV